MRTRIVIGVFSIIILGAVGTIFLSLDIFNRVNEIDALCARRSGEENYTPDNFAWEDFDTTPYAIDTYEAVSFPARDGVMISGFFIPAPVSTVSDASTVIIAHGFNDCKRRPISLTPAGMLQQNGFNSLVIDLRNHGDSEVTTQRMTGGVDEAQDVLGAWDWLIESRGISPDKISVFGYSMGGATIIHAMSDEQQIVAGWSDSTFDSMDSVIRYQLGLNEPPVPEFFSPTALLVGQVAAGVDLALNTTADALQDLEDRPLFLLHSTEDELVPYTSFETLIEVATGANIDLTTWEVTESKHVLHMFNDPSGYEERLITFFTEHLN